MKRTTVNIDINLITKAMTNAAIEFGDSFTGMTGLINILLNYASTDSSYLEPDKNFKLSPYDFYKTSFLLDTEKLKGACLHLKNQGFKHDYNFVINLLLFNYLNK